MKALLVLLIMLKVYSCSFSQEVHLLVRPDGKKSKPE
jgi:hypothetical protein